MSAAFSFHCLFALLAVLGHVIKRYFMVYSSIDCRLNYHRRQLISVVPTTIRYILVIKAIRTAMIVKQMEEKIPIYIRV